ncbi:MAG TPA: ribose 5-phosphate isomerase A, partial [Candidatus Thalassarchaeaceae archaeon]|nr:ribose 5-phosphate isomerase A [Candidatus Thalassarchaeaceae archaeon]
MSDVEALKREAGIAACDFIENGMKLGLGTGSTVRYTVIEIGRRMNEENLSVVGVPTSESTRELAESLDIPLVSLADAGVLDLVID